MIYKFEILFLKQVNCANTICSHHVRHGYVNRLWNLSFIAFSPHLPKDFGYLSHACWAYGVAHGDKTATAIYGMLSVQGRDALLYESSSFSLVA